MKIVFYLPLIAAANAFVAFPMLGQSKTSLMSSVVPPMDYKDPLENRKVTLKPDDKLLDPSYFITLLVAAAAPVTAAIYPAAAGGMSVLGASAAGFHVVLAALLWVQTNRVRCVFHDDGFEFYNLKGPGLDLKKGAWLEKKPANFVTEARNRWRYDSIAYFEFFPNADFPVIIYMKETQTPQEQWNKHLAVMDTSGGGQPHFFPGLFNGREFKAEMEKHGVKSRASMIE